MLNILNSAWQNDQLLIMGKIFYILLHLASYSQIFNFSLHHQDTIWVTGSGRHSVRGFAWVFFSLLQNLISEIFRKVIFESIKFLHFTAKKFRAFRSIREQYVKTFIISLWNVNGVSSKQLTVLKALSEIHSTRYKSSGCSKCNIYML